MKLTCLACEVFAGILPACIAESPHALRIEWIPRGLHDRPARLRAALQAAIDQDEDADAVALAYGLCGQAAAGLAARRAPLVLPRAHDCITLLLGSRERYQAAFAREPGTYWYAFSPRDADQTGLSAALGSGSLTALEEERARLSARYDAETVEYILQTMGAWQQHYRRGAYIDLGQPGEAAAAAEAAEESARRGWAFERLEGSTRLLRKLVIGPWDEDFLVVPPGQQVRMTYDADIIGCQAWSPACG